MSQISSTVIPVIAQTLDGGMIVFYSVLYTFDSTYNKDHQSFYL